jgi:hypothetical protein
MQYVRNMASYFIQQAEYVYLYNKGTFSKITGLAVRFLISRIISNLTQNSLNFFDALSQVKALLF